MKRESAPITTPVLLLTGLGAILGHHRKYIRLPSVYSAIIMNHPFIIYLLLGFSAYVALGVFSYSRHKNASSDEFLFGAIDILLLPLWPIVIPYMLINLIRGGGDLVSESNSDIKNDDLVGVRATTVSELRPSGRIRIGSVSELDLIPIPHYRRVVSYLLGRR